MIINFQHDVFIHCNPETGEYDENEIVNPEGILSVQGRYCVCPTCQGNGTHFRRDLDENRLIDNMREDGDDEGIEAYYNGAFDQICEECRGNRVVAQPILPKWAEDALNDWYRAESISRAIEIAELRAGC